MHQKNETPQGGSNTEVKSLYETNSAPVRFTRLTSIKGLLTKRLSLDGDGDIVKAAAVHLSEGTAEIVEVDGIATFCDVLSSLGPSQALAYGVPLNGSGRVFSRRAFEAAGSPAEATTRTEAAFTWPPTAGVLMVDHDPLPGREPLTRESLLHALYGVCPELRQSSHSWWPSSSSMIFEGETERAGLKGQRVYVLAQDATDIERAGRAMVDRLWLAGHGAIFVSASGSMHERTVIDASVFQRSRLDFAGGAMCEAPLSQRRGAPLVVCDGLFLNTVDALPSLTSEEQKRKDALVRAAKAAARPEADRVRSAWVEARGDTIASKRAIEPEVARSIAKDAIGHQRLRGDFILTTDDGQEVTVAEVMCDPSTFHERRFRHPLESDYPDYRIGHLNLKPTGGKPYLFVHAHGGVKFTLHASARTIQLQAGAVIENVADVMAAMRESGRFFARGADIVVVNDHGVLVPLGLHALKHELDALVSFVRWLESKVDPVTGEKGKWAPTDCPDDLAHRVRSQIVLGVLPSITGVVTHGMVLPNGRVLVDAGFDKGSGLMLVRRASRPWPRPRDYPTTDEVHRAISVLWQPFRAFPFASDSARGVHLAALLTAVVRKGLRTSPMFLYAAPTKGSGKSLLCECVAALAGGESTPASALPADEAEIDKLLVSVLRAGSPVLWLDNVTGSIKASALCRLLTSETYEARILGRSETTGALPTRMLVVASGNNVSPSADMTRRTLRSYLDPQMENPAARVFDWHPLALVRETKDEMISAALTVLAAWIKTGDFKAARGRIGSFEEQDCLVGQCVRWIDKCGIVTDAGERFGDPKLALDQVQAEDTDAAEAEAMLATWVAGAFGAEMTAAAIFAELIALRRDGSAFVPRGDAGFAALGVHEAGWAGHSAKSLGRFLAAEVNKIAGGYVLRSRRGKDALLWRVERAPLAA